MREGAIRRAVWFLFLLAIIALVLLWVRRAGP